MKTPLITHFREGHPLMRATAAIVLLCFTSVFYSPAVHAAVKGIDALMDQPPATPTFFAELQSLVIDTRFKTTQLAALVNQSDTHKTQWQALQNDLKAVKEKSEDLDDDIRAYFDAQLNTKTRALNKSNTLKAQYQHYQQDMALFQSQLTQLLNEEQAPALKKVTQEALKQLASLIPDTKPHGYDNFSPFGPLDATARPAQYTLTQLQTRLGLTPATPANPDLPLPEDSAATLDAPHSTAIQNKAAELHYDPLEIYNWVYNTIRFIPSYGSIQGAEQTLAIQAGNAMDTTSLLIALLRASSIPARYHYGTVRVPYQDVMNWVGGVEVVEAAQNLLAQGGIPSTLIRINGEDKYVDLEHSWAQAYINGQWVALDPSFKQYTFTDGIDLAQQVPFDAQAFVNQIQTTATTDETAGWVQNVDQATIQTQMDNYKTQLENYINNNLQNATVGEVIGQQQIIQRDDNTLPTALPYEQVFAQTHFSEVPDKQRHKFQFTLLDEYDNELLTLTRPTVELVAKKLAFSFSPATPADEQALLDYLPQNPQTPEELPNTIPADLFQVKGQFTIDGITQSESATIPFGRELKTRKGLWSERGGWQLTTNPVITGEYQAIGLDLHGMSAEQLQGLQSSLTNTKTQLEAQSYDSLTKHDVVGDLLQSGVMGYMAMTHVQAQLTAQASDIVYYREPSYGTFSTNSQLVYLFSQPHEVKMTGLLMDIDRMKSSSECKQNCWNNWVDYNKTTGHMLSAYEHIVPEQIFSTTENPVEGISAVKALSIASAEGQRIYTIKSTNLSTALQELTIDQSVKDEITQAVNAGYEVTTSQHAITKDGWTGVGYIIIDPQTGAGAYKISGGADGSVIDGLLENSLILGLLATALGFAATSFVSVFFSVAVLFTLAMATNLLITETLAVNGCSAGAIDLMSNSYLAMELSFLVMGLFNATFAAGAAVASLLLANSMTQVTAVACGG